MKVSRCCLLGVAILFLAASSSVHAQYSARRLTRRVAPQPAPAPQPQQPAPAPAPAPGAPQATPYVAAPAVMVAQPPVDPEKVKAEHDAAARKAAEFRKQREAENAAEATAAPGLRQKPPLTITCDPVTPDSNDPLQSLNLSVSNNVPREVTRVTLCLKYFDAHGRDLKEWTTYRRLDQPIPGQSTADLSQPAYFMPLITKRVEVEVKEVQFADGSHWPTSPAPVQ